MKRHSARVTSTFDFDPLRRNETHVYVCLLNDQRRSRRRSRQRQSAETQRTRTNKSTTQYRTPYSERSADYCAVQWQAANLAQLIVGCSLHALCCRYCLRRYPRWRQRRLACTVHNRTCAVDRQQKLPMPASTKGVLRVVTLWTRDYF